MKLTGHYTFSVTACVPLTSLCTTTEICDSDWTVSVSHLHFSISPSKIAVTGQGNAAWCGVGSTFALETTADVAKTSILIFESASHQPSQTLDAVRVTVSPTSVQPVLDIPGPDPNAQAIAVIEFRWPQDGSLGLLPYDSYQLQWVGEWVSENGETTDVTLQTYATQTITVQKDDIYLSRLATFPALRHLRGGRWTIALQMTGGPNHDPIGLWPCIMPSTRQPPTPNNQLPYLAPSLSTLVTFQGNDNGSVTCTAALTLLFFPTPTPPHQVPRTPRGCRHRRSAAAGRRRGGSPPAPSPRSAAAAGPPAA